MEPEQRRADLRPEMEPPSDAASAEGATGSVADRSQVEVERRLEHRGFGGQFGAREGAQVLCFTCHREFGAAMVDAGGARRVEGESDPADMAIMVPVICPHCHTAGILALQFGPMASVEESDVIAALPRTPPPRGRSAVGGSAERASHEQPR